MHKTLDHDKALIESLIGITNTQLTQSSYVDNNLITNFFSIFICHQVIQLKMLAFIRQYRYAILLLGYVAACGLATAGISSNYWIQVAEGNCGIFGGSLFDRCPYILGDVNHEKPTLYYLT